MSTAASARPDEFAEPPASGAGESNRWLVLVIVCLAQFMVILDATVVNVALPSIQTDLGFSEANLQWVINSYTLMFGGFLLLGGRAGDLFGRRRVFLLGVAVFSFASLLNGLATSDTWLVATRGLQGLGGALVSPAALSIITTTFAEGEERTKALGVWSAIAAGGGAFGLLLGGILTDLLTLGVDLLRQRADRDRDRGARDPLRAGVARGERAPERRPARRGHASPRA